MPIPDKVQEALVEIYDQGFQEGYAAAKAEFDAALVDAQRAGYDIGRNEVYHILTTLPRETRLQLIEVLESKMKEHLHA